MLPSGKTVRSLFAAAVVAVPLLALAPAATADSDPFNDAITTTSSGFCVGHIDFELIYGPDTPYFGLVSALHGIGPCSVEVAVNWRNLDTGAAGTVRHQIYGTGGTQIRFDPGPGRITGTLTTNALHKPGSFEFQRTAR
ncbi:hypothetical protein IU453_24845 [Nocardia cyriacigeorgica]|uniref:hypothetical protein n=1 Tax=Nocardia cyriacigeorgica TaxID=135487 RepID=UPI00189311E2|nr:hypothetical protein [Nocardia cyriacigeorgica]MBF6319982.1 hypothetical protein [Nocardia cyriacigeorgica]MBF6534400.1 hypothetical protein [Nocardia cyriacigeorgica]